VAARAAHGLEAREARLKFAGWTLDISARQLLAPEGAVVMLTSGEFRLLRALVEQAGRVLSRDQLLNHTQGREASPFDRSIDLHISRLRAKLRDDARMPALLKTVRNEGYLLAATVEAAP
jgi:two-component system OmpR family response regulator